MWCFIAGIVAGIVVGIVFGVVCMAYEDYQRMLRNQLDDI